MRARRPAVVLAIVTALSIVAGCATSGKSDQRSTGRGPATSGGPATAPSTGPAGRTATLHWKRCDGGAQCARLAVPLDYAQPAGEQISLAIVRRPATKPSQRIGSLLINPGGPGASAVDFAEDIRLTRKLRERFDIVGFDPRGVGRSTPLDCHRNLQAMYDADPTIDDQADHDHYLAESRTYVDACRAKYLKVLPFLGTRNVARDMDRVRAALGDAKLNYVGYSYGSSVGEEYANQFPTKVRAMVLDGVVNNGQSGLSSAESQAGGFEKALGRFLDECGRQSGCGLGRNPGSVLDKVLASADRRPIPASRHDRPAGEGVAQLAIAQGLYSENLWPDLAQALKDASDGDGNGLVALADDYLQRDSNGDYPNFSEGYFAVGCLDSAWPKDPQAVFDAAKMTGKKYPRLGEASVLDYVRCALWPTPPQPLEPVTAPGSPPILVISTTNDPATPYQSGVEVAKRLSKGVLLTNVGDGHTIFGQGKSCVDDTVTAYLVDLDPPKNGLRCR